MSDWTVQQLVPHEKFTAHVGVVVEGGVAVCPSRALLAISSQFPSEVKLFRLTPHGLLSLPTVQHFNSNIILRWGATHGVGQHLAFTDPVPCPSGDGSLLPPFLLVGDNVIGAIHVVDVDSREQLGYVASPGTADWWGGLATQGRLVAATIHGKQAAVLLFQGSGSTWALLRVVSQGRGRGLGFVRRPSGVAFSPDGSTLAVVDTAEDRVTLFQVSDGAFQRVLAEDLNYPVDIAAWRGGWLVTGDGEESVGHLGADGAHQGVLAFPPDHPNHGKPYDYNYGGKMHLGIMPDLGVFVSDEHGVTLWASSDSLAMFCMSAARVAWMGAVARGVARRKELATARVATTYQKRRRGQPST